MDESRKAFEQWYQFNWGHTEDNEDSMFDVSSGHGSYYRLGVRMAYDAWQASRAAIEIKLDDKVMIEDEFDRGHNCAIDYCADAIRSAGIKVKE